MVLRRSVLPIILASVCGLLMMSGPVTARQAALPPVPVFQVEVIDGDVYIDPTVTKEISGEVKSEIARLRSLIAPMHSLAAAADAGFNAAISPCIASPMGGMGFHYANMPRLDGVVKWDEPEVLVFAPSPDAKDGMKLGAVEYIVPKALVPQAPVLFGETFVEGGPGNSLWTLHVWVGINNPAGLFAPWNTKVSCPAV